MHQLDIPEEMRLTALIRCPMCQTALPFVVIFSHFLASLLAYSKAFAERCSVKKMFTDISQDSQDNTWAGISFFIKLQASGLHLY